MTLRVLTARYNFVDPDRLDITRAGCDRALRQGLPAPGAPWAPPASLLWPAKAHLDLAASLRRRGLTLPEGSEPRAWMLSEAEHVEAVVEEAYARLFRVAMIESWRSQRPAWDDLLRRDRVVLVCMCRRRSPAEDQRHTCHRGHLAARILVKLGAIDLGEAEQPEPKAPPAWPLPEPGLLFAAAGCRPPRNPTHTERDLFQRILADVRHVIGQLPAGTTVITGGARGVDEEAEIAARAKGLDTWTILPWWDAFGPQKAPLLRNAYNAMVDWGAAWPGPKSIGTWDAIRKARAAAVEFDVRQL